MAKVYRNSAEVLAERAMGPDRHTAGNKAPVPPAEARPRRMIYNGTMPVPPQTEVPGGITLPPTNRKVVQRRVSPFNLILLLMALATAIVLYIGNIIAVDQLVNDIHKSDVQLQDILNEQEILRARISQMSSLEHIRKRAEDELGLKNPSDVPGWITVDQEKLRSIEEATQGH